MGKTANRPRFAAWLLTAALTLGASAGPQRAAEPAPPSPAKKLSYRDIQLTVHARKALAADPQLGPVNLGVRVQDNTAVLWGPAPSEELKRRAVEIVKAVKGVFEVRDGEVYIAAPPPPVIPASPPPEAPTKDETGAPDAAPGAPAALTGRGDLEPSPVPIVDLKPPLPFAESDAAQAVAASPSKERLGESLESLRQSDPRYRAVDCRLNGDILVLRPGAGRAEDMMALARAASHLPGLSRIVILGDAAEPSP